MRRSFGTLILLFLACTFLGIGWLVGIYIGQPILEHAKASTNWPNTQGKVVESKLETKRDKNTRMYSAYVLYTYTLDGGELSSDRVWYGPDYSTSNRSEMQKIVSRYPVGQPVTVFYSPDDPTQAVLEPGATVSSYIAYVIGMVFMGVGGILLVILFARAAWSFAAMGGSDNMPTGEHDPFGESDSFDRVDSFSGDSEFRSAGEFVDHDNGFPGIPGD